MGASAASCPELNLAKLIASRYQIWMEQAIIRKLKDGTLAPYRAVAKAKGTSLEAELREVIERNVPKPKTDPAARIALALKIQAMTLMPGGDSTAYIRWSRDTNAGRLPGCAGFEDDRTGD